VAGVVAGGFGIGIVLAFKIYTIQTFEELSHISGIIKSSLAASTALDFMIASTMCFYLHKSRGSESRLNSRISVIMQYTLSSGLFTSACSLSTLFTYTLMPNNLIFLSLQFLSTKFYVGSFLAMLNARQRRSVNSSDRDDQEAAPGVKQGIEFKVHTSTFSDGEVRHWDRASSTSSASSPQSPSDSLETETTYASFDQSFDQSSKKSAWDVDIVTVPAHVPVQPVQPVLQRNSPVQQARPEYMTRW
jgi:hypothetical protein